MAEKLFEVQLATPERNFTKVYNDFLDCTLLTAEEKMMYIAMKSFVTYGNDSGQIYPSMERLCRRASLSIPRGTRTIKSLVKKGIVEKKRRGLNKTNLYRLVDIPDMWLCDAPEEMKQIAESKIGLTNEEMIAELTRRGAITIVETKKAPTSSNDQITDVSTISKTNNKFNDNFKVILNPSQETYTLEQVKEMYFYDDMVAIRPELQRDLDMVLNILYDTLNTSKETIRVSGDDKPAMVVISKLRKLSMDEIIYCIDQYGQQTEQIKNHKAYMITLLYNAREQFHLDYTNRVQHDMYGGNNE